MLSDTDIRDQVTKPTEGAELIQESALIPVTPFAKRKKLEPAREELRRTKIMTNQRHLKTKTPRRASRLSKNFVTAFTLFTLDEASDTEGNALE